MLVLESFRGSHIPVSAVQYLIYIYIYHLQKFSGFIREATNRKFIFNDQATKA